ncbi:30S ribosomal protein S6 [Piptocephalis cylindrospora]|uniref:30S ribosomal protein S6 n=1 Tax=Piptocephalis cylindrospora TaxID=1907219 RepID=A0A4P9Y7Z3_9FUNG|nr:30S ribosomal protein S6 [Piptocephalis cylindrospora]|eukprot:RKP14411.1 30S ribosomal protein S6 [Piptocephalis cylindrospora]
MPFYELVCISRAPMLPEAINSLLRSTATAVMSNGGVVRQFRNYGAKDLPFLMKRHGSYHAHGHTWLMLFDANPSTVGILDRQLRLDARIIRSTVVKLGERLEDVIERPEQAEELK